MKLVKLIYFLFRMVWKKEDALSQLFFNFALECAVIGPWESGGIGIEWNTSAPGLCWRC